MLKRVGTLAAFAALLFNAGCAGHDRREVSAVTTQASVVGELRAAGNARPVRVSPENADAAEPAIAVARDGTAYVAWVEHRDMEADVWLARLDSEGASAGAAVRVNPEAGAAKAWHGDPPSLAVAPDGAVYVLWTARADGAAHATTLRLAASRDGGRSFETHTTVNDDAKPVAHGMHSLAVAADGRLYAAWLDERNVAPPPPPPAGAAHKHVESNREVFAAASSDGGRTFSANRRVAADACPCCKTSLAASSDGRVYVSWRQVLPGDYRHIAVASTADGGQTFTTPVVVSDDQWQINGCPVSGASLVLGPGGALRVLWYTSGVAGEPGLYWTESRDHGATFARRQRVAASGGHGTPALLTDEDGFVAVWESHGVEGQPALAKLKPEGPTAVGWLLADAGELPVAASAAGRVCVAYIRDDGQGRAIWVVRGKASDAGLES